MKNNFKSDLKKEALLHPLIDSYYQKLKHYTFERISDLNQQLKGVDVILKDKRDGTIYFVDEKAQLDYLNESLPTFAFEIQYLKKDSIREGWLFDSNKKTQFYTLATSIFSDEEEKLTSCQLTFINREKLLELLKHKGIEKQTLVNYSSNVAKGKIRITELNPRTEGYLYLSRNKAEAPLNLILKLNWLIDEGVGKSFP
ncbi:hypothetical protein [Croceivirga thetidis]|uniref:Uncharacterized protein n=1 Tax=Croceivirga thetidis TaxID=2721623 RepID=A0ABX1GQC4_9FLAO|nr:hypothetical protein [Croceivirga thetidis]NKI31236.1 hypothetical protein [Croceivirga thetidis]